MKAIETQPLVVLPIQVPAEFWLVPSTAATTMWQIPIPAAPTIRNVLRPKLSRNRTAGRVKTIWKHPVTPVARRSTVTELKPKVAKIWGA